MKFNVKNNDFSQAENQCLMLAVYENQTLSPSAVKFNQENQNILTQILTDSSFTGKIGDSLLLTHQPQLTANHILLVGCGKGDELTVRQYKTIIKQAIAKLNGTAISQVVSCLNEVNIEQREAYWNTRFAIEAIEEQLYVFDQFKSQTTPAQHKLTEISFYASQNQEQIEQAIKEANAIALGVKAAKDVANCPPNVCNPAYLADQAYALAHASKNINTQVINEQEMESLGMNAYLAVASGAKNEAFLSIIEYKNHPDPNAHPIVLVGKGLTFDAGGISLKPADSMDEMKYDMCGAATVYGVMKALAELNLPLNVIGVLAGCENLPDGNAYRPGDILTTMKGLTVEVLNTDAEGRLVLADTLTYVERFKPALVIDIATLTGACVVALGQHNSGLISTDENLAQQLQQAAQQSADKAWRLPLSEEYQEQLKSNFADLANIGGRWGGAITAGAFLANFTKDYAWAHLDIAGTAWLQGANKGATGRPVPLLVEFLLNQAKLI